MRFRDTNIRAPGQPHPRRWSRRSEPDTPEPAPGTLCSAGSMKSGRYQEVTVPRDELRMEALPA